MYAVARPLTEATNSAKQIHFLAVPFRIARPPDVQVAIISLLPLK
jgi:hypothetical protein